MSMASNYGFRDILPDNVGIAGKIPHAKWTRIFEKVKTNGEIGKLSNKELRILYQGLETQLQKPKMETIEKHLSVLNSVRNELEKRTMAQRVQVHLRQFRGRSVRMV